MPHCALPHFNTLFVDKVEVFTSQATSVKPIPNTDLGFKAYPNPATTVINFENKNAQKGNTLLILDNIGKIMHYAELPMSTITIDLNQYANGIYFYEIYNANGSQSQTGKFVK